jgi:hypothetical protein
LQTPPRRMIPLFLTGLLGALLVAAFLIARRLPPPPSEGIATVGGKEMHVASLAATPYYLQTDDRWKQQLLGPTREPIAAVGCTLCCVSMALTHYGVDVAPDELNRRLTRADGYTSGGWLKWNVVPEVTGRNVEFVIPRAPTHQILDNAIAQKHPAIIKVVLRSGIAHWVLVAGKDGREYLVKDPLYKERSPRRLSEISDRIHSVRILRRRGE